MVKLAARIQTHGTKTSPSSHDLYQNSFFTTRFVSVDSPSDISEYLLLPQMICSLVSEDRNYTQ